MKYLVILAAVLLVCQAAKMPQEVTHQVVVAVPSSVLAAPTGSYKEPSASKTEIPAQVMEVARDQEHVTDVDSVVMTTAQPEAKTMMPFEEEITTMADTLVSNKMIRKTRAVPFTDLDKPKPKNSQQHTVKNVVKAGPTTMHKMSSHRSMRSVSVEKTTATAITAQPVAITENPAAKSTHSSATMSSINPCDLLCTKFEFEPICATNGLCLHEFPNQCILETYNCKHPSGKFIATKDDRCQMHWLTKCDESEMI